MFDMEKAPTEETIKKMEQIGRVIRVHCTIGEKK